MNQTELTNKLNAWGAIIARKEQMEYLRPTRDKQALMFCRVQDGKVSTCIVAADVDAPELGCYQICPTGHPAPLEADR